MVSQLGQDCFFPNPVQSVIHQLSCYSMLYSPDTESIVKWLSRRLICEVLLPGVHVPKFWNAGQ
jgi:hypothetical protein